MAKALIVIPHDRFRDEEFQAVYEGLKKNGHAVCIGSSHHTEAKGHFGLLVKPDIDVDFVEVGDYDAIIFIGGRGIEEYLLETSLINLIRAFYTEGKPVGAIGMAVELLIYAGVVSGRRVTCDNTTIQKVQAAGGYYTGRLVEEDGDIITGSGVAAKDEFAEAMARALKEVRV